jgi:hypothetical protein
MENLLSCFQIGYKAIFPQFVYLSPITERCLNNRCPHVSFITNCGLNAKISTLILGDGYKEKTDDYFDDGYIYECSFDRINENGHAFAYAIKDGKYYLFESSEDEHMLEINLTSKRELLKMLIDCTDETNFVVEKIRLFENQDSLMENLILVTRDLTSIVPKPKYEKMYSDVHEIIENIQLKINI